MENIDYNELIQRGYKVDVGVAYNRKQNSKIIKEIDFIVNDINRKVYIQCCYQIDNDNKDNTEIESLFLTNDFY